MAIGLGFSRAVRVGTCIIIGGTGPVVLDGRTVGVGDTAKQAERCFEIVGDALSRAGSGWYDAAHNA